jgi:two-component system, cell cycle response regulator CpdR
VPSPKNSVVIVNENIDLANLFRDVLEQQSFDTHAFTDPSLALEKIRADADQVSLVLTDYPTPKGTEINIAKEVKSANQNIKVMLTSGYDLNRVDIANEGYDKFIQIPVKLSTLISTVKEMLDS